MLNTIPLDYRRAQQVLASCAIGHTIEYYPTVDSTMILAQRLAEQSSVLSGTVIVAEEQSSGRGRQQRRWEAPANSALLLSVILKTPQLPSTLALLPALTGLAVLDAITTLHPILRRTSGLKWPNDVLLGNERSQAGKVAGILIESTLRGNGLSQAVIGVGINVNQTGDELPPVLPNAPPATSLANFLGRPIDRTELLIKFCQCWSEWLDASHSPVQVWRSWRDRLWTLGESVAVYQAGECIASGTAVDVTAEGGLIVRNAEGVESVFHAGDVSIRAKNNLLSV